MRNFHRNISIADTHCGHQCGLTPPEFSPPPINERMRKFWKVRRDLWAFFSQAVDEFRPYDSLIFNGDLIDGKGSRSGGTELITSDRKIQGDIARAIIDFIDAKKVRLIYGTPYHVGTDEDHEDVIDALVKGSAIGSHQWFNINGKIFDVKHKIGSSQIPHGRLTPMAREILWNRQWAGRGEQPRADVILRAHNHYYEQCDHDGCLGFNMPCLQGFGSKYGSRECSGTIDMGILVFDVYDNGEIKWTVRKLTGKSQRAKVEIL